MDKYELVLDIVEHPEKYTSEQLAQIMSDPETKEIYNILCKAVSAIEAEKDINVDAEWEDFAKRHTVHSRRPFVWFGNRAASIAATIGTSLVAVAAGIAVTVAVIDNKPEPAADNVAIARPAVDVSTDKLAAESDSVRIGPAPIMFENEPLEKIMQEVAETYGVEFKFNNKGAASLHMYYKFDPSLPLSEVIEQLNTFEQINIKQNGTVLIID